MFIFNRKQFKKWYLQHAQDDSFLDVHSKDAQSVMISTHKYGFHPQFILSALFTKSKRKEFYFQTPVKIVEPTDLTVHKDGYDYFVHSQCDGFVYFKNSADAAIYGVQLIKEYEECGWTDELQLVKLGKITGNVVDISGMHK